MPDVGYITMSGAEKPAALTFSWQDINVINPKTEEKVVDCAAGMAEPGSLLAILGSSGAGKTSLLNALTFRNMPGLEVTGHRFVNQELVDHNTLTRVSAYVQQEDLFMGTLTVKEHLLFQAMLRMENSIGYKNRLERVQEVICDLGLSKCQDTLIGIPGRIKGISGGEKKRLSFASEILTNPSILFCDEPTSGVDSYMADHVVELMRELAKQGRTVITTIHQPSSEIFSKFTNILLMAEGRTAFIGDIATASTFITSCGYPCPPHYNPADHFIQVLTIIPTDKVTSNMRVNSICDEFTQSAEGQQLNRELDPVDNIECEEVRPRSPYTVSWCRQFRALLWRSWLAVIREPRIIKVRILQTIFTAVLIGGIYFGQELDQDGINNINGVLYFFITNLTFSNVFAVINVFCMELPLFLREHHNGMYRTDVYFLTKQIAELPVFLLLPALLISISYYLIQLNPDFERFLVTVGILELLNQTVISYGYFISCLCSSLPVALSIASPIILPLFLVGGLFLKNGTIPFWLDWLKFFSWFLYSYEALLINQWSGVDNISCKEEGKEGVMHQSDYCLRSGQEVLEERNFHEENFYFDLLMLTILVIGLRMLAFLALLFKTKRGGTSCLRCSR